MAFLESTETTVSLHAHAEPWAWHPSALLDEPAVARARVALIPALSLGERESITRPATSVPVIALVRQRLSKHCSNRLLTPSRPEQHAADPYLRTPAVLDPANSPRIGRSPGQRSAIAGRRECSVTRRASENRRLVLHRGLTTAQSRFADWLSNQMGSTNRAAMLINSRHCAGSLELAVAQTWRRRLGTRYTFQG